MTLFIPEKSKHLITLEEHIDFIEMPYAAKGVCALPLGHWRPYELGCVGLSCSKCVFSDKRSIEELLDAEIITYHHDKTIVP